MFDKKNNVIDIVFGVLLFLFPIFFFIKNTITFPYIQVLTFILLMYLSIYIYYFEKSITDIKNKYFWIAFISILFVAIIFLPFDTMGILRTIIPVVFLFIYIGLYLVLRDDDFHITS